MLLFILFLTIFSNQFSIHHLDSTYRKLPIYMHGRIEFSSGTPAVHILDGSLRMHPHKSRL